MQLNIYIISHPVIKQLSSQIANRTLVRQNIYNQTCKQLGFLMLYEVMRKWMQIQNIYIKQINQIKPICILDKEESYIVITDLVDSYNIVTDALDLLPKVELHHINLQQELPLIDNKNTDYTIQINRKEKQKIIIINLHLNNDKIIRFLNYLIMEKYVKINQIKIICITCEHQVLEKIGNKYPNLNIYTTKIL